MSTDTFEDTPHVKAYAVYLTSIVLPNLNNNLGSEVLL
jgi:hypothetical protein